MVSLYWFILFPVIVGIAGLLLSDKISNILSLLGQTLTFVYAIMLFFTVHQDGQVFQIIGNWPQSIGIGLKADTTSIVFVLLTSFLFLILILFSMNSSYSDKLFNFLFLSVEGLISCVFLANDLFTIFVSLEVSTIIVSILIMYKKDKRSIYDGMMYLLINIFAMSFFLLGLGMLYKQTGFLDIGDITKQITLINNKKDLILPYAFMLTAVSLKSALMPLFSWLPKAHGTPGAPAVVSALLSGLFVKSGIYLFIRLQFMFSAAIDTQLLFLILGFTTAIVGIILCLQQTDIKLILAYSTVAQLGLIMIGLNFSSSQAFYGSLYHIINHAIFKVGLFLAAGLIIEEYQTRDINKIKGLLKRMPATGIAIILFSLAISGAPFFNASISKYFIASGAQSDFTKYGLEIINFGTIFIFVQFSRILIGKTEPAAMTKQKPIKVLLLLVLALFCLLGGIWGVDLMNFLWGQNFQITISSYLEKTFYFTISVSLSFLILIFIRPKVQIRSLKKLKSLDVSFNTVCLSVLLYFSSLTAYLYFF